MRISLLLILIALSLPSFGSPKAPITTKAECQKILSVDERFSALAKNPSHDHNEYSVGVTRLIADTLTPVLIELHQQVVSLSPAQIQNLAALVTPSSQETDSEIGNGKAPFYNKEFGLFQPFSLAKGEIDYYGLSLNNRGVMRKLSLAARVVARIIDSSEDPFLQPKHKDNLQVLRAHSYTTDEFAKSMYYAGISLLQAASHLTAEPVAGLTAEELMIKVLTQVGPRPSLMVMYSLMLPPALIGRFGSFNYYSPALSFDADAKKLSFTAEFRDDLKKARELTSLNESWEMGHGCPVGHCSGDVSRPGLQYYLDAILYVMQSLN